MNFEDAELPGVVVILPERAADNRGFFARLWDREIFALRGLNADVSQCSVSYNVRRGTLRGMHYQSVPHAEAKLVRCVRGAIYDVAVDIRVGSPTYGRWVAWELTESNGRMLYIPEGVAHGYQTLRDSSEVLYQISSAFQPSAARGFRWDDPSIKIVWPIPDPILSERDAGLGVFTPELSLDSGDDAASGQQERLS